MFRTDNPTNKLLANSLCFFKAHGSVIRDVGTDDLLYNELLTNDGYLAPGSDGSVTLTIPHSNSDAFGGVYAINHLATNSKILDFSQRYPEEGTISYQNKDFKYFSWIKPADKISIRTDSDSPKTFLQTFLERILALPKMVNFDRVALPICLDDLRNLSADMVWGNSLVIVTFRADELLQLAGSSKEIWRETLKEKALRVSDLLKRRPNSRPLHKTLLISSLGSLDGLAWANQIDPRSLTMIPTPMSDDSVNVILWASRGAQVLSICANNDFPILNWTTKIHDLWSGVISGTE